MLEVVLQPSQFGLSPVDEVGRHRIEHFVAVTACKECFITDSDPARRVRSPSPCFGFEFPARFENEMINTKTVPARALGAAGRGPADRAAAIVHIQAAHSLYLVRADSLCKSFRSDDRLRTSVAIAGGAAREAFDYEPLSRFDAA